MKKKFFRPSKWPLKFRNQKTAKTSKLPENGFELVGIGGWPQISTSIHPLSLGRNVLHCVDFPWDRGKSLLNLDLGEFLTLLEKLRCLACGRFLRT
jgi:hypothetical protein